MSAERVLITGASGFIGGHLARLCHDCGATVFGVGRSATPTFDRKIRWRQADLTDASAVQALLEEVRPTMVFHLAGFPSASRAPDAILPTFQSNLVTTVNLLHATQRVGRPRIVLSGSLEELNDLKTDAPSSPYAVSKTALSLYARMFHELYSLPITTARTFMVYGPAQADLKKLIPSVIHSLLRKEAPKLSSGTREVDWVYVEDVAAGYLAAALSSQTIGKTVDIGTGRLNSIRELIELLVKLMDSDVQPIFGALPDRPMEQVRMADAEHTFALTGWRAQNSLAAGLRKTIEWYRSHLTPEEIKTLL